MNLFKRTLIILAILVVSLAGSHQSASGNALLIEDILPWDFDSNSQTLTSLGIPFTKISSNDIASYTLSNYQFVVFSSVQNQPFYDNVAANFASIDNYVKGGGTLIAHSALWGWPGNGEWVPPNFLPGGVGRAQQYSNSVVIVDPTSPIIAGPYGILSDADFQAWNYSTHGYFTNLVPGTNVIIGVNDPSTPCYIEYAWGAGIVRATMMTVEWGNNDPNNTRYIFRENEFYAAQNPPPPIPEPGTMLLLGISIVSAAGYMRKRKMD